MKKVVLRLLAGSVALIIIGIAVFPLSIELARHRSEDPDGVTVMLGFLAMVLITGVGISLGIASLAVMAFHLRDR